MSGFGAPARTAMPMLDRTRSMRLPRTTLPSSISPSSADAARITTSIGSPRCSRFGMAPGELPIDGPNAVTTLCPLARSNCGTSSRYAAVNAPDVTTLISSAAATAARSTLVMTNGTRRRVFRIIRTAPLARQAGYLGSQSIQRLARGHVERLHVGTAERVVGDEVLGNRDELEQLALRRNDVDACFRVERFRCASRLVHAGGRVQVALRVDAHAVCASARIEVVVHAHVAHGAVRMQVVRANHAGAALR